MFKMSHKALIIFSGCIWLAVGCFLLPLGLNFLMQAVENVHLKTADSYPLLNLFSSFTSSVENSVILLVVIALFIGYTKGRYVLGKSAIKGAHRIRSFPNPTALSNIYSAKYYILLIVMIGLGMSMKFLGIKADIRGFVDVAVGAALINGAMIYFKLASQKEASLG